jgi:hypothetical protein
MKQKIFLSLLGYEQPSANEHPFRRFLYGGPPVTSHDYKVPQTNKPVNHHQGINIFSICHQ